MINKLYTLIIKFLFLRIYLFITKKKFSQYSYEYNFQNINFTDELYLKKTFLSDKYFEDKFYDEQSYEYHSFNWLPVAKKLGSANNVIRAKKHLICWYKNKYNKNLIIWNGLFISKRFVNIIYNYEFFAVSSSIIEKDIFHNIILEHYIILNLELKNKKLYSISIEECKALILGSVIYKKNINNSIALLKKIISTQIDTSGFHKSYNPLQQVKFLNHLYEIKNIILYFNIVIPEELSFQLLNMSSLLISLVHKDDSLALFNGSNNFFNNQVLKIIKQGGDLKSKNLFNIKYGIASYTDKNKKIFFDVVKPINSQIDNNFHASTLSFELSCKNEKIITNCGSILRKFGKSPDYLRYSAAHSTIILNNTNISELIDKKSYKRFPKNISFNVSEDNEKIIWECSHDGYIKNFQKLIRRKIEISKKINAILGQDEILSTKIQSTKYNYSIRFHLMPYSNCLITNDRKSILIKTKLNQSWIFKSNSVLLLEDSIYVGNGKRVEQNKQIVIYGSIQNTKKIETWSLIQS
jgi:uncharacterized heparinase superfamily protein